jgi:hypothetical protein
MAKFKLLIAALAIALIISLAFNAYQWNSNNLALNQQQEKQKMTSLLVQTQANINAQLQQLDNGLQATCQKLSTTGLTGTQADTVLRDYFSNNSLQIVNVATADANDVLLAVQPSEYKNIIGQDISGQEQNVQMHQTTRPAMSDLIPLVEGFPGVVMVAPVFDSNGKLMGSLSIVIQPGRLIGDIVEGPINGTPISMWAMQTNGTLLYDPDPQQQGHNLFTDSLYTSYPDVQTFVHQVATAPSGYGTYQYYNTNLDNTSKQVVQKEAYWTTIGVYEKDWRLVIVHATNP